MLSRPLSKTTFVKNNYFRNHKRITCIICSFNSVSIGTVARATEAYKVGHLFLANSIFISTNFKYLTRHKVVNTNATSKWIRLIFLTTLCQWMLYLVKFCLLCYKSYIWEYFKWGLGLLNLQAIRFFQKTINETAK